MPRAIRSRLLVNCEHLAYKARTEKNGKLIAKGVRLGMTILGPIPTGKYPLSYLAAVKHALEAEMERVRGEQDGEALREGLNRVLWEIEREASKVDRA